MNGPYFQDGAAAYDYVIPQVITAILSSQIEEMNIEWYLTEIHTDVGVSPNSIKDSLKLLRLKNALRPAAKQATSDDIAEKLLNMISNASSMFTYAAQAELNAVEGAPGTPGVRQFQLPIPKTNRSSWRRWGRLPGRSRWCGSSWLYTRRDWAPSSPVRNVSIRTASTY